MLLKKMNPRALLLVALLLGIPAELSRAQTPLIRIWDDTVKIPRASDLPLLADDGLEFHVIKNWEPDADGYKWLHGVALAWHGGRLFASFGHNKGAENTASEEARFCVSENGGRTWGDVRTIDAGTESPDLAVSHGVFLTHGESLWAFHGAFYGRMKRIHTRAYQWDDVAGE